MYSIQHTGSNGHEYQFLLKGHEDLRQDERVMQLFGLVNSLLLSNPETLRRNLTYVAVIITHNLYHMVVNLETLEALLVWSPPSALIYR